MPNDTRYDDIPAPVDPELLQLARLMAADGADLENIFYFLSKPHKWAVEIRAARGATQRPIRVRRTVRIKRGVSPYGGRRAELVKRDTLPNGRTIVVLSFGDGSGHREYNAAEVEDERRE